MVVKCVSDEEILRLNFEREHIKILGSSNVKLIFASFFFSSQNSSEDIIVNASVRKKQKKYHKNEEARRQNRE